MPDVLNESCDPEAKEPVELGLEVLPSVPVQMLPKKVVGVDEETFARDIVLLIVNHGIPWKAAELIVKLVNSHIHGRFLGQPLPSTAYQLKNMTNCLPGQAKLLHVCPVCDFVFDGDQEVCTPCGLPSRMRVKRQLLVNDVRVTIQQMFALPKLAEAFEYAFHRQPETGMCGMEASCETFLSVYPPSSDASCSIV